MLIRRFSIAGYAHLYRSLLRFTPMSGSEAKELVYLLNTANLDTARYFSPSEYMPEAGPVAFSRRMDGMRKRPYRTEVQLYKALAALKHNILRAAITGSQREAVAALRCVMRDLEFHFYMTFGVDIFDRRTVYTDCAFGLIPREDEPSVCLTDDRLTMPGA